MHRSGTSMTASVAAALGAASPSTLMAPNAHNVRGFFESQPIMELNDEILLSVGSTWPSWRPLSPGWEQSAAARDFLPRMVRLLNSEFGDAALVLVKDPRICRLHALWVEALQEIACRPRHVLVVRSPLEVALSLQARDGFTLIHGLLLWLRYNLDAERVTRGGPRAVLVWSQVLENWRLEMLKAGAQTGLEWPRPIEAAGVLIDQMIDPALRHHEDDAEGPALDPRVPVLVLRAYTALKQLAQAPHSEGACVELDEIEAAYAQATDLLGPCITVYEQGNAQLAGDLRAVGARRDALSLTVADSEAKLLAAWTERNAHAQRAWRSERRLQKAEAGERLAKAAADALAAQADRLRARTDDLEAEADALRARLQDCDLTRAG